MAKKNSSDTKLRWEECYAKLMLEKLFPDRFYQLSIVDKPDLQNPDINIGIEVTTAIPSKVKENDRLFSRLTHDDGNPKHRERSLNRVAQLGGEYYEEGYMFSWAGTRDIKEVYSALENKLTKLNSGKYTPFEKQYVFITENDISIKLDCLNEIHAKFSKMQNSFSVHFDSVFLNINYSLLIEFDMKLGKDYIYRIDDFESLTDKAYHMVNG